MEGDSLMTYIPKQKVEEHVSPPESDLTMEELFIILFPIGVVVIIAIGLVVIH